MSSIKKMFTFTAVPAFVAGAVIVGPLIGTGHAHAAAGYYPAAATYALAAGRDEQPHNEPAGEFLFVENAPTMGTASTTHLTIVAPGGEA